MAKYWSNNLPGHTAWGVFLPLSEKDFLQPLLDQNTCNEMSLLIGHFPVALSFVFEERRKLGCRHSTVDSFAPSILPRLVRVPKQI